MRRAGLALAAAGILLLLAAILTSPSPTSSYELGERLARGEPVDASRVRISAHAGSVHSYDAANDTTYVYVAVCSHQMCGPLVPVEGDLRGRGLPGPVLLAPAGPTLTLVPVPTPRDENETHFAFIGPRSQVDAFSGAFEARSPWPPFLARVAGIGLAAAGVALALRRVWWAALPGALGPLASLLVAQQTSWIILVQILGIPVAFIALVTAGAQALFQRRGWVAAGIALGAAVAVATSFVALGYFPGDGGD